MEIIERAKKVTDGEIVSWNENPKNIEEEVLRRACKAGYCNRDGSPVGREKISSGWTRKLEENYDRIFRKE